MKYKPKGTVMQRTEVRIVAGSLRGRKLTCVVHSGLRPTPQRVREAMFSILGNAIPDRPFIDVFAGTGVVGLEAISRGASWTTFIERDPKLVQSLSTHMDRFGVKDHGEILRTDAYRWSERWIPRPEPTNVFLSPPFADLTTRLDQFFELVARIKQKLPAESLLFIQAEEGFPLNRLPDAESWETRRYGRNLLIMWEQENPEREFAKQEARQGSHDPLRPTGQQKPDE